MLRQEMQKLLDKENAKANAKTTLNSNLEKEEEEEERDGETGDVYKSTMKFMKSKFKVLLLLKQQK